MKYILRPMPEQQRCFLLDALYWVAFYKYPEEQLDITADNLSELLEFEDDQDNPVKEDYYFTFFDNELCEQYNFPKNPASCDENPEYKTYLSEDLYQKILNHTPSDCLESVKKQMVESNLYYKKLELFEHALAKYLDFYKAKLFVALYSGKIKAKALTGNKKYIYNNQTKKIFLDEIEDEEDFEKLRKSIKHGDTFYAYDYEWSKNKAVDVPANSWEQLKINWQSCQLENNGLNYIYIQVDMQDLLREFSAPEDTTKTIKSLGNVFVMEDDEKIAVEIRGRKPKMDYSALYEWFVVNIEMLENEKFDYVIELAQEKFTNVSRTTIKNKISPLIKAYRQKKDSKIQK